MGGGGGGRGKHSLDGLLITNGMCNFARDVLELPDMCLSGSQCLSIVTKYQLDHHKWNLVPTRIDRPSIKNNFSVIGATSFTFLTREWTRWRDPERYARTVRWAAHRDCAGLFPYVDGKHALGARAVFKALASSMKATRV